MTFLEFMEKQRGPRWAICRNTAYNRARYGECISKGTYAALQRAYVACDGNPAEVEPKIATEWGWRKVWRKDDKEFPA